MDHGDGADRRSKALKRLPEGTTLLVVSHRLATLHDYDLVVVLGDGQAWAGGWSLGEIQRRHPPLIQLLLISSNAVVTSWKIRESTWW